MLVVVVQMFLIQWSDDIAFSTSCGIDLEASNDSMSLTVTTDFGLPAALRVCGYSIADYWYPVKDFTVDLMKTSFTQFMTMA